VAAKIEVDIPLSGVPNELMPFAGSTKTTVAVMAEHMNNQNGHIEAIDGNIKLIFNRMWAGLVLIIVQLLGIIGILVKLVFD